MTLTNTKNRIIAVFAIAALLVCTACFAALPQAHAFTKAENKAYNRVLNKIMDYKNQPQRIEVSIADLGLSKAQVHRVAVRLHSNGELFWVNTYDESQNSVKKMSYAFTYSDSKITSMRKKVDKAVKKALERANPGMPQQLRVHMLHDWLIDRTKYVDKKKDCYCALVKKKADCFGFAQGLDVLLRRAGFTTDIVYNETIDHSWNQVKVNGKWYNVDVGWDEGYTGKLYWKKERCHRFLLQSDAYMKKDDHGKGTWECNRTCTSDRFDGYNFYKIGYFVDHCKDYKKYPASFSKGYLKYKVTGIKKVSVKALTSKGKNKKTLTIPATVTYKGKTYKVTGIKSKAFAKAKVKTLKVATAKFSAKRVKGSLTGSKVKTVKLTGSAKAKKSAYKTYFKKANAGKKAKVKK